MNNREKLRLCAKENYKHNAESYRAKAPAYWLKRRHGITVQERSKMIEDQDFKCAICGIKFGDNNWDKACIDHDHVTNKIRGILCHRCNVMLGLARDNKTILQSSLDYLS